jgi:hypothetical protein
MRKINDYLQSGSPLGSAIRVHAKRMEEMLAKLQVQLGSARPDAPKTSAPDVTVTWRWVESLVEEALDQIDADMEKDGFISERTAWQNQQALIAAIISGLYLPPCRVHVLITMVHPRFNNIMKCADPDCLARSCMGNHLQLDTVAPKTTSTWDHFDYNTTKITNMVVHHKNDR